MQNKVLVVLSLIFLFSISIFANKNTENLARQAVSKNTTESKNAIKSLREMNQAGLDVLFEVYSKEIEAYSKTGRKTDSWQGISKAIDSVAMQKDAYSSKLFWHTDFSKAKAEAQETNKPILTLRLLGNLNEEYSCANSRFFRSILYSNEKIANELRENYVLHWKSVRPAPKVTIDFGDGRKIVRTITGNSIHYVLDKKGNVIEALPGLYNPKDFHGYLAKITSLNNRKRKTKNYWQRYRTIRRNQILSKWQNDLKKLNIDVSSASKLDIKLPKRTEKTPVKSSKKPKVEKQPTALKAAPIAVTKSAVEMPTVLAITHDTESLKEKTTFELWQKLAKLYGDSTIDKNSRFFIKNKTASEKDFAALIKNLEKYVGIDTVQNEYVLHTKIYEWLNEGLFLDVDDLNEKIYAEIFLTPKSDKWLGLYSPDIYSAIENNGIVN